MEETITKISEEFLEKKIEVTKHISKKSLLSEKTELESKIAQIKSLLAYFE